MPLPALYPLVVTEAAPQYVPAVLVLNVKVAWPPEPVVPLVEATGFPAGVPELGQEPA